MRNKSILLAAVAAIGLVLHSCAPDPVYSYPPEYKKPLKFTLDKPETVTFSNQNNIKNVKECRAGDSVTVYLPTAYSGVNIYKATYKWTSNSDKLGSETIVQIAPCDETALPPKWTFEAPDSAGKYIIYFRATYNYSAATENGAIYGGYPTSSDKLYNKDDHGYEDKSSVYGELTVK